MLVLVAAVTLAVGGVGIMNIMLANVRVAHSRDRHSQGAGRDLSRDQAAVSGRGGDHLADRRDGGRALWDLPFHFDSIVLRLHAADFHRGRW